LLQVQRELEGHLRDRDKEREAHRRDEAIQHFCALLSDLIRGTDLSWHEAKKVLRKDKRWDQSKLLEKEEKEKLFDLHIESLTKRKKEKFR
jgi:transcription elongation regulator 1